MYLCVVVWGVGVWKLGSQHSPSPVFCCLLLLALCGCQDLLAGYGSGSDSDDGKDVAAPAAPALAPVLTKFPVAHSAPLVTYDPVAAVTVHGVPMVGQQNIRPLRAAHAAAHTPHPFKLWPLPCACCLLLLSHVGCSLVHSSGRVLAA